MLVSEVIEDIRMRTNDKEGVGDFEDKDIISYINQSINYIGSYFVTTMNPIATKVIHLDDGDTLPKDFIKTAGMYPIKVVGRVVTLLENVKKGMDVKYYFKAPNVTSAEDEMPYEDEATNNVIVNFTVICMFNQQRINVSQDKAILDVLTEMLTSAYGHTE